MTLPGGGDLWIPRTLLGAILLFIIEVGSRFVGLIIGTILILGFTQQVWLQVGTMTIDAIIFFAIMTIIAVVLVASGIYLIYDMNKTFFQKEDE